MQRKPRVPPLLPTETELAGPSFTNPVYKNDFPDPHVILVDDTYYAYAHNGSSVEYPCDHIQRSGQLGGPGRCSACAAQMVGAQLRFYMGPGCDPDRG